MIKKIVSIVICMLMFATAVSVAAKQNTMVTPSYGPASINDSPNNFTPIQTFNLGRKTAYAWALTGMTAGPMTFDLSSPGAATSITASTSSPYAGTWANDKWYIITATTFQLKTVNPTTGAETFIGNTGVTSTYTPTGMAYSDITSKMYGTWAYAVGTVLYTAFYEINLITGVATHIGTDISTDALIDIACNSNGQFYGIGLVTDSLYSVNPTVPSITLVGSLGILLNYAQGAEFDKDTDILYLAAYIASGALYTCNTTTGACTLVGAFPSGAEVDAFAIPYTTAPPNNPPVTPAAPSGPNEGFINIEYQFNASTTDPEGDNISYMFDWGDSHNSGWVGPYASGAPAHASHIWTDSGVYQVKVKAKDENNAESNWSSTHTITIIAGPVLKIGNITGGLFKIKTTIKNIGEATADHIEWTINLTGGFVLSGKLSSGPILSLAPGSERTITSKPIIGFGKTVITITATVTENSAMRQQNATLLLFLIKIK